MIVREKKYDASRAKTTPRQAARTGSAGRPSGKNIGTNTMQMQMVETKAGTAICCAASRMASSAPFRC